VNDEITRLAQIIAPLRALLDKADYMDVKTFTSQRALPDFIARMIGYQPGWLKALYTARKALARLLGLSQVPPSQQHLTAEDVNFTPGGAVGFFTTLDGDPGQYWIGEAADKHLCGYIGVVAEPNEDGGTRFSTFTIVHYRHWTGPVYFNLIRPFHHLVVHFMGNYAARE